MDAEEIAELVVLVLVFAFQSWEAEDTGSIGSSEGAGSGRTVPLQRTMSPSWKRVRMACLKSFLTISPVGP